MEPLNTKINLTGCHHDDVVLMVRTRNEIDAFTWYFNGNEVVSSSRLQVNSTRQSSSLILSMPRYEDEGIYQVSVSNIAGTTRENFSLTITGERSLSLPRCWVD